MLPPCPALVELVVAARSSRARRRRGPACLWLLCALVAGAAEAAAGHDARLPVLVVPADAATPAAAGAALGQLAKQARPDLERRWDGYLATLFDQPRFERLLAARVVPLRAHGIDAETRQLVTAFAAQLALVGRNLSGYNDRGLYAALLVLVWTLARGGLHSAATTPLGREDGSAEEGVARP